MHLRAMINLFAWAITIPKTLIKGMKALPLLIQSAIADIKSSTKETVALFTLAEQLYKSREYKRCLRIYTISQSRCRFLRCKAA